MPLDGFLLADSWVSELENSEEVRNFIQMGERTVRVSSEESTSISSINNEKITSLEKLNRRF